MKWMESAKPIIPDGLWGTAAGGARTLRGPFGGWTALRPRGTPQAVGPSVSSSLRPPGAGGSLPLSPGAKVLFVALLFPLRLVAQPAAAPQPLAAPPPSTASVVAQEPEPGSYRGPASCASSNCHGSTEPRGVFDVLQNEYFLWLQRDRHSKAHEVLFNEQSRLIARNLELAEEAAEAPRCLACHAFLPPEPVRGALELEDGISCEACHGPASGWLGSHTEESWTRERAAAAGLVDLADPVRRGELCLGCHLGNDERKIDHRLLAAGHPRLAFELDNFSSEMPEHWKPRAPADNARSWAVGQATALAASLRRLVATAADGPWPELSLMSCGDCHHSLTEERWRRTRGRRGRAALGAPRWSPASWMVPRLLVHRFAPGREEALRRALARVSRQVEGFGGDRAAAARAATEAAEALDGVAAALAAAEWGEATLVDVLGDLAALDAGAADHAAAEQIFWAANALTTALVQMRPELLRGGLPDAVERLYVALRGPYEHDPQRFAAALAQLRTAVRRLP